MAFRDVGDFKFESPYLLVFALEYCFSENFNNLL